MPYGTLKVDNIIFTNDGVDQTITVSGIVASTSGNLTATGTISGNIIRGGTTVSGATVTGSAGQFGNLTAVSGTFTTQLSGVTVTGTTANFTSGNFTSISGGTHTITSGVFAAGTATNPSISFASDPNTGIYRPTVDEIGFTTNGQVKFVIDIDGQLEAGAIGSESIPTYTFSSDSDTGIYSPGANQLAISTNGSGRLYINSSGDVGVGVASPAATFGGGGGAVDANGPIISRGALNAELNSCGVLQYNSNVTTLRAYGSSAFSGVLAFATGGGGNPAGTGTTEYMRLTADGKLGLGTSSPNVGLTISSQAVSTGAVIPNADIAFPSAYANGFFRALGNYNQGAGVGGTIQLGGKSYTDSGFVGAFLISAVSGGNATDALTFSTQTSFNNVVSERMRLDSSGRLGIGTTSPTELLHINGNMQVGWGTYRVASVFDNSYRQGLAFDSANRQLRVFSTTNDSGGSIGFYTRVGSGSSDTDYGTERARIDSSGRLLVGTSSASAPGGSNSILQTEVTGPTWLFAGVRNTADAFGPSISLTKTRGTTPGSTTTVINGDQLGGIYFLGANGSNLTNFGAAIEAYVDGTVSGGGANDMPGRLVFSVTKDGQSSPTERLRIAQDGRITCTLDNAGFYLLGLGSAAGTNALRWSSSTGLVTADTSSRLVKTDVSDCPYGINELKLLKPRKYFRTDDSRHEIGFIADEVIDVMPEFVPVGAKSIITGNKDDKELIPIGVNYEKLTAVLTVALQEALAKIEALEAKVAALEAV